ncbi:MAG: ABC transporter ATP-binding protein [Candidatus Latescibacterota bacterium]|jgi:oligopeptide/dipeptide ABC transporter ATP-binding protein|nr:ABC transporter ATP-binding protein [Candidatus Latescibacterota bacterium]
MTGAASPILEVRDLRTSFHTREGEGRAVDGVSFHLDRGETLGLVGESGCGKSVTALSILGLVAPPGRIGGGQILLSGRDLLTLPEKDMRQVRGDEVAMVFQEPMSSLNPVLTCGRQIEEAVRLHQGGSRQEAKARAIEMMHLVGIPAPEQRVDDYPHQLSGGMRQRVMIAIALSCSPDVLIADEPTTALDVTIQAQILELLEKLQAEFHMAILLITHDLGVVAEVADRVAVMYAGQIVETATTKDLFASPRHPYTRGLLRSIPHLDGRQERLEVIPGRVPEATSLPFGCRFHPRCSLAESACEATDQSLEECGADHEVRCRRWSVDV